MTKIIVQDGTQHGLVDGLNAAVTVVPRHWSLFCERLTKLMCMLLMAFCMTALLAVEVTPEQARIASQNWIRRNQNRMQATFKSHNAKIPRTVKDASGRALCHVVDMDDGGFVVTSGDTKIDPIIAFSSSGNYDSEEDSPLEALLARDSECRLEKIRNDVEAQADKDSIFEDATFTPAEREWAELLDDSVFDKDATSGINTISDIRVPILLSTKWGQSTWGMSNVYNYYTPNNSVCGCVATAGAQIMKYWECPKGSIDSFDGNCTVDGVDTVLHSLSGEFDWSSMPLSYASTPNPTETQRQAIGKLTYNVGVAVEMSYTARNSGANTAYLTSQLRARFGYVSGTYISYYRTIGDATSITDFQNALYASLDAEMPVSMSIGTFVNGKQTNGHSIVADGYGYEDGKRYTHLNMGWSGQDDIWYNIPDETLTDDFKFNTIKGLGINIHPYKQGDVISGRVLNSGGNPVSGAMVNLLNSEGTQIASTNTNSRGIYSFRVTSAGGYSVSAKSGSLTSGTTSVSIPSLSSYYSTGNRWGNDLRLSSGTVATKEVAVRSDGTTSSGCTVENDSSPWMLSEALPPWINSCSIIDSRSNYMVLSPLMRIGFVGSGSLSVDATENTGTSERTCVLSISNTNTRAIQYRITVRQSGRSSSYTISFNANGGIGSMANQAFVAGVSQRLSANGFSRNGYEFKGWATSASGSVVYYDQQNVTAASSMTLYAVWSPLATYMVTFNANGGSGTMSAQTFTQGISQELRRNVFTRSGYEFAGWARSATGEAVFYDEQVVTATENMTLYAAWDSNQVHPANDNFANPTRLLGASGSTTGSNVGATYETGEPLCSFRSSATNTVWWVWTAPSSGQVQFSTDGSDFDTVMGVYVGTSVSSLTAKAQDDDGGSGRSSLCLFTAVSGTTYYIAVAGYGGNKGNISLAWSILPKYTVVFNSNGGTGTMASQTFTAGIEQSLRANAFVKSGTTFAGWTTNVNGAVVYSDGERVMISTDTTLYAKWSAIVSLSAAVDNTALTFTTGGVTGWSGQTSVSYDGVDAAQSGALSCGQTNWMETTVSGPGIISFKWLPSCYYEDKGLEFYIDGKLQNGVAGISSEWGAVSRNVSAGTHTLRWQFSRERVVSDGSNCGWVDQIVWTSSQSDKTYAVKFNRMDFSGVTVVYTFDVGISKQLPRLSEDIGWSYPGHVFLGWSTNNYSTAQGQVGVVHYADGASVKDLASVGETAFFYAVWGLQNTCTVSFNANGGTVSPTSKSVSCDSAYGDLPTPTKAGYFFEGWYTAASDGTRVFSSTTVTTSSDHTLYAHWTEEPLSALSISKETASLSADAQYGPSVTVTCDGDWNATTTEPWIRLQWDGSGTTGNRTLVYRVEKNLSTVGRTGSIAVSSGTLTVIHTVYQEGVKPPAFTVSNGKLTGVKLNGSTEVVIPDGVKVIGGDAFPIDLRSELLSVAIPASVTNIEVQAFAYCGKLKSIVIPDSVVNIGDWAFYGCWALENLTIGSRVENIGRCAFGYSYYFTEVVLPRCLKMIGEAAFKGCRSLSSVLMPRIEYAESVFEGCASGMRVAYYGEPLSIFFHANGGTGGKTLAVPLGAAFGNYMDKVSPQREGYVFGGWWTARTGGDQVRALSIAIENATYYAHWIAPSSTCSVFFHANGGIGGKTLTVVGGTKLGASMGKVSPKRDGYVFDGWWTARTGGTQIDASDVAVGNATYYAHWRELPATCSVFFHANGGTGGKTLTVPGGAALGAYMDKVTPKRDGYAFDGWWTARTGGTQILASDIATCDATYYAHWVALPATCKVFFHANGGTGGKTFTVAGGASLGGYMYKVSPARDGYAFDGWWTARTGGTQILASDIAICDATYYAHWIALPVTCKVFFHANGGTGGKTFTVAGGAKLGTYMDKVSPKRDGYSFGGWWTARTGGKQIFATDVAAGDVTYYAHWTAASACVRPVNVPADVSEAVSLANYYGYVYAADGGEAKMLLTLFEGGKATALVGDDVYQGELPILSAPDGATLRIVLEGDAVFGFQQ